MPRMSRPSLRCFPCAGFDGMNSTATTCDRPDSQPGPRVVPRQTNRSSTMPMMPIALARPQQRVPWDGGVVPSDRRARILNRARSWAPLDRPRLAGDRLAARGRPDEQSFLHVGAVLTNPEQPVPAQGSSLYARRRHHKHGVVGHRSACACLWVCRGTPLVSLGLLPVAFEFSEPCRVLDDVDVLVDSHRLNRSSADMRKVLRRHRPKRRGAHSIDHRYRRDRRTRDDDHRGDILSR
jgi:hypothetical protein